MENKREKLIEYITKNEEKFYRLIFNYIKSEEQTLDVMQNAIYKALKNLEKLKEEKYMETWFYRIVINESLKYLKQQKKEPILDLSYYNVCFLDKNVAESVDLYKAINSLKPKFRNVIILRYFEDKTLIEISEITNTNLSTVKTRLYKALNDLKSEMRKDG